MIFTSLSSDRVLHVVKCGSVQMLFKVSRKMIENNINAHIKAANLFAMVMIVTVVKYFSRTEELINITQAS